MILLRNATFIDWQTLAFTDTNILVEEGENGKIRYCDNLPAELEPEHTLDCTGFLVTKSFACGHHHIYSALARGMGPPRQAPRNFHEVLKYIWWTLDKCLDLEMIRASALYTALACAKNGVTFVIDHHASPHAVEGSLEVIAEAFDEVGVGHLLCYEISDRDGESVARKGLEETERYLRSGRQALVGLHASFTVGDDTLAKAVTLAQRFDSGIHIHVAEDPVDQEQCLREHGKRVVERLQRFGVTAMPKSILAHCLHLSPGEKEILRNARAYIVYNTDSNLNNNVGYFDSRGLGNNIMLGTDGMHSDMLRSAKAAFLVGQGFDEIDYQEAYARFRKVHHYLEDNGFAGDGANNLVVLDYDSPTAIHRGNFPGHFIFGLESRHVRHVIASGRLILKDREVQTVDEGAVLRQARALSGTLWERMAEGQLSER
ncbi:MAG: amidohydrolase family protein [Lewinellaceae bacterium]|nr:amidohydrolase family protein [Lewinellaceae bacterium]